MRTFIRKSKALGVLVLAMSVALCLWCFAACTPQTDEPCEHELVEHQATVATDTATGNVQYWECSKCHRFFADAKGEAEITDKSSVIIEIITKCIHAALTEHPAKDPTDTTTGNIRYWECNKCHKYFEDSEGKNEIIDKGSVIIEVIINCPHDSIKEHPLTEATCTTKGNLKYWECEKCHKYFEDSEGENEITDKESVEIPLAPHALIEHSSVDSTCTTKGKIKYWECNGCGKNFLDSEGKKEITDLTAIEKPIIPHSLIERSAVMATCTKNGNIGYWECEVCHKYFEDSEGKKEIADKEAVIVAALDHHFEDGKCTRCNEKQITKGLEYKLFSDEGYCAVIGIGTATDTKIIIPSTYNELPVKDIYSNAFKGCTFITGVEIPDSVTYIGYYAFMGCTSLTSVEIPNSVTYIGNNVFEGCTSLTSASLPSGIETIRQNMFYGCSSLVNVQLPNSVKEIEIKAFYGCSSLGSMVITSRVTNIGQFAFAECYSLTTITFERFYTTSRPSTLNFGYAAFSNCYRLVEIIDNRNMSLKIGGNSEGDLTYYALKIITNGQTQIKQVDDYLFYSVDDVNYLIMYVGKDTKLTLPNDYNGKNYRINKYAFSGLKNVTSVSIPSSATAIGEGAFMGCASIANMDIPSSVTDIGEGAFMGCASISNINIPSSVTAIGKKAFDGCYLLKGVYVADLAAWCKINFGDQFGNPMYYAENLYVGNVAVINLVIPDTASSISEFAFYNCNFINSVVIPDSVTSVGKNAFFGCTAISSMTIPFVGAAVGDKDTAYLGYWFGATTYQENSLFVPKTLKSIEFNGETISGKGAFYGCDSIENVTVGNKLKSIKGESVFYGCSSLKAVYITDLAAWCKISFEYLGNNPLYYANYLYLNNQLVTNLVIPDGVTSIGDGAFNRCYLLKSVTIPSSVTSIGNSAFGNCYGLVEVINKSKLTITAGKDGNGGVGDYAKNVKTAGESDVVNVNGYLFYVIDGENYLLGYSGKAESLVLPDSFNGENYRIYDYAFYKQKDITSVTIPNCVTSIGYSAFCDCSSIGSIDIPNSVTSIGEYAFDACGSLESLTIGKGVTEVGNNAFNSCDSLNAVYITDLAAWCKIKFANGYGCNPLSCAKNLYLNNEPVANLVIPDGVTSIGDYTFYGCTSLKSVTMGDSVTSVGDSAFSGCNALVVVIMGSGVTSINECAFYRCNALSSVIVGSGVTSIKDRAFYGCEKLLEVINKSSLNIVAGSDSYGYVGYYAKNISNSGDIGVVDVNGYLFFTTDGENYLVGYVGKDKSLVLPNNYNGKSYQIYKNAFSDNSVITSVTISGNITSIGESAFSGCKSLTSVTISGNVASVDKSAFSGCKSLTSVTISGNDTMTVGESAFSECYSLEGVYISDIAEWLKISFNGNYGNPLNYAKNLYLNNELLTNLIIPDGVTSIGKYAFGGCYSLKSVTIPSSVTSIGNGAFV